MAILILQERGKLALEDPIGKYLDDAPATWEGVTIHHLLTHTSGVPSYTSDPEYGKKMAQPETVKSMIDRFKGKPMDSVLSVVDATGRIHREPWGENRAYDYGLPGLA